MENPKDLIDMDPGITIQQMAAAVYQGVQEGKLDLKDVEHLLGICLDEIYEPMVTRIYAKAVGYLLERKNKEGIFVEVDNKQWIVHIDGEQIKINGPSNYKDAKDGDTVTMHDPDKESESDVKIDAYLDGGKYIKQD